MNELELIQSIVKELSGMGFWLGLAYVFYLLASKLTVAILVVYTIRFVVLTVVNKVMSTMTRREVIELEAKYKRQETEHYAELSKKQIEVEKTLHRYNVMKERMDKVLFERECELRKKEGSEIVCDYETWRDDKNRMQQYPTTDGGA